ncbi:MAG TPA: hypothetical protein VFA24_06260 [Gaiellaceae bacterium]|nr:hypothetical protein [Gaiellaceae bacterium]
MAAGIDAPKPGTATPFVAGLKAAGEFRCAGCGYGISISGELPRCPMCGEESWEELQLGGALLRPDS